jgi:ABC-type multidrug transport system fused ATPase/permease subunit
MDNNDNDLITELETHKAAILHGAEALQDETFNLSFRAVNPVDVDVRSLSLEVDTTPPIWETAPSQLWSRLVARRQNPSPRKTVLADVDARMPSGSLTAIIGSSGSGKTTMLNLMAGRMGTGTRVTGSTTFNGDAQFGRIRSAYVMQDDVLIPTLTVRETLRYSADLRLPPPATAGDCRAGDPGAGVEGVCGDAARDECS